MNFQKKGTTSTPGRMAPRRRTRCMATRTPCVSYPRELLTGPVTGGLTTAHSVPVSGTSHTTRHTKLNWHWHPSLHMAEWAFASATCAAQIPAQSSPHHPGLQLPLLVAALPCATAKTFSAPAENIFPPHPLLFHTPGIQGLSCAALAGHPSSRLFHLTR